MGRLLTVVPVPSRAISRLFRPWRQTSTWWSLTYVLLDAPLGIVTFVPIVVLLALSVSLLVTFPLALIAGWLLFVVARGLGQLERSRANALLGTTLTDPIPPLRGTNWWRRLLERVKSGPRWREIAYCILRLPLGVIAMISTAITWCGSAALIAMPLYVRHLPSGTAKFGLFDVGPGIGAWSTTAVGLIGIALIAPWLTHGWANVDRALTRRLLGRRGADLEARVAALETSRAAAVDSAEAERRRIERDLHDGAQQRLIALAMGLGVARERIDTDPKGSGELVALAHEEAKAALRELRDLVRGIHPAILEDRGLDAALSAVIARTPIPVQVHVEVPERPAPAVESTAYFVVSEALTNVTKHARATSASVEIFRNDNRLHIEVSDNGIGGADPATGTGLRGLRDRVDALDGAWSVSSPPGGPTTLRVELPCAS